MSLNRHDLEVRVNVLNRLTKRTYEVRYLKDYKWYGVYLKDSDSEWGQVVGDVGPLRQVYEMVRGITTLLHMEAEHDAR